MKKNINRIAFILLLIISVLLILGLVDLLSFGKYMIASFYFLMGIIFIRLYIVGKVKN